MSRANTSESTAGRTSLDAAVVKVGGRGWNVDFTLDDEIAFHQLEDGVRRYLNDSQNWFSGQDVTVNVGHRALSLQQLDRLRLLFEEEFRVKVANFWCGAETPGELLAEETSVPMALAPVRRTSPIAEASSRPRETPLFIKSTCRSGTIIRHNGDVIVLGDLNPGAQITATGDIIVLGTLRGIAHAGAKDGDPRGEVIIAFSLQPLQIRIGRHVSIAPADRRGHTTPARPEIAYLNGSSIVVTPYTGKFQRTQERNGP